MNNTKYCRQLLERVCRRESGRSLSEFSDENTYVEDALEEMEALLESEGSDTNVEALLDIAQEAVYALMDEEHLTEIVREMPCDD